MGNQSRPDIFDLGIKTRGRLYEAVEEIDERVGIYTDKMEGSGEVFEGRVEGTVTGENVRVIKEVDLEEVKAALKRRHDEGFRSVAVVFMHSYLYPAHEVAVGEICADIGYSQITLSHQTTRMVKIVPRGQTSVASAYLTPSITEYLEGFKEGFGEVRLDEPLSESKTLNTAYQRN